MILVFGSNVLDMFFHHSTMPPKGTAVFLESHEEAPGGKGANQAVAAARAGSKVRFYGALGKGGHGRQMSRNLEENGIQTDGIQYVDIPSAVASIFIHKDGDHSVVVSHGANKLARQDSIPDRELTPDTYLLLQGELEMAETEALIQRAAGKGAKVVVNLAPPTAISKAALDCVDYLILNEHEANAVAKQHGFDASNKEQLARTIAEAFNLSCLVTLGPDGVIAAHEGNLYKVPALKVEVKDTIGAGDAFSGFFTAALEQGMDFETAVKRAIVAGSLACTRVGAQTALPQGSEVDAMLKKHNLKASKTPLAGGTQKKANQGR